MAISILRRALLAPLVMLNFCLYIILLGIAGWALNQSFDHGFVRGGNPITLTLVIFALISGVVGIASVFAGLHHLRAWRTDSFAAAGAAGLIAWLLTLLTFGVACKHVARGDLESIRLHALEAISIILAGTQLLYLMILHTGVFGRRLGGYKEPGYVEAREAPPTATTTEQKSAAAAAV